MWSEEWDKKFRDVAGQDASAARQDQGWNQMEQLLDEHLPVKKRRKRLFLLFFLLAGTGLAVFLSTQPFTKTDVPDAAPTLKTPVPVNTIPHNSKINPNKIAEKPKQELIVSTDNTNVENQTSYINKPTNNAPKSTAKLPKQLISDKHKPSSPASQKNPEYFNTESEVSVPLVENTTQTEPLVVVEQIEMEAAAIDSSRTEVSAADSSSSVQNPASNESGKKKKEKAHKWGFSLMAGADISGTGINNPGEWRGAFGFGISYDINPRWTIRTGFLVNRKVYGADSNDYNPPKVFWNYVSELENVDANCLVYEIPLNVLHYFKSRGNGRWFASAGLSTFLMKKETYHYNYKDLSGQSAYMSRTYNNYSHHAFSILQISGGYQFKVGKNLTLGAEPYFKLPIGGVGYGKVKLQSAGVLFSATIKR